MFYNIFKFKKSLLIIVFRIIRSCRDDSFPTVIVATAINETKVHGMLSEEQWRAQEAMDPEQGIGHNRELYTVWNEKTNFMMTAARENFFSSDYFLWLDIGAVRQGEVVKIFL